jgi:hypothetical protein
VATLQELKRQIENANAVGIKNLAEKGVGFAGFTPTTYEIMQCIADIIRDGGSSPSIDENGIVTFGGNTTINDNGIVGL